jgi:hypothetical protein
MSVAQKKGRVERGHYQMQSTYLGLIPHAGLPQPAGPAGNESRYLQSMW